MRPAEVFRRITLFASAAVLLAVVFFYGGNPKLVPDTLPLQLSNQDFWEMVTDFSESGGYFRSDNFLSNESGYQFVIPYLRKTTPRGGAYIGVGPEQNFTYVMALEPKIAFVIDIRRQNMLEHLLYKALMEISPDRVEFMSRLFARPRPASLSVDASPESLVRAYRNAAPSEALFESNFIAAFEHLTKTKGFGLSVEDESVLRYVYHAFYEPGPDLRYTFVGGYRGFIGMPSYGDLMTENDGHTRNWNFLASEEQFQSIRRMQERNLIVPLVGDFAGPKAIRSVAEYLKKHKAVATVFYTSNVEQYLFQDVENWKSFYENASALPVDSSSVFIRYVLNGRAFTRRSRTLLSSITATVRAYQEGMIRGYYDVVDMSR